MKTNYNVILTLLLAFSVHFAFAQKTITGTVSDETGPLPGVSVLIKGTTTGTETDFDGNYAIEVKNGDILQYSFIGMETDFKTVGSESKINVVLTVSSDNLLEEVVINALGIETRQVSRTASVSKVKGSKISESGETSLVQGLSGKASGVSVVSSSGDPGSSAYIQIRGQTSITRDLQPLFVVDGIPLNNDEVGNSVDGVTQQSRISDINPNDIASVKILKGASAAALWGSRASNGVILITTKTGRKSEMGTYNVSIFSKFSFDSVLTRTNLQNLYGKGANGNWSGDDGGGSWGDLISARSGEPDTVFDTGGYFEAPDGTIIYPINQKNDRTTFNEKNYNAIFGNGLYVDNGVSVSSKTENGNFFVSLAKLDQDGTIGGGDGTNFYQRYSGRFNASLKEKKKLKLKGSLAYSNTNSNRVQQGSNLSGLLLGLYRTPADFDNTYYVGTRYDANGTANFNSHRAYRAQGGTAHKESPSYNNPLWTLYKQKNPTEVHRFVGSFDSRYNATSWLQLIAKVSLDSYTDQRYSLFPINSSDPDGDGLLDEDLIMYNQYSIDFLAQIDKNISDDLTSYFTLGANAMQRTYEGRGGSYTDFILDTDQVNFGNATTENIRSYSYSSLTRTAAFFGVADFNFKDILLLHLTGRAEQASTFGDARVFFYPSAELGFQFSSLKGLQSSILNKGKLRIGYGKVGNQPSAYATNLYYNRSIGFDSYGTYYSSSAYNGAFVPQSSLPETLRPEILTEFEVGLDLSFWNSRLNLTTNFYKNKTDDALLNINYPASTGFQYKYANAGAIENTGIEMDANFDIIRQENFNWNIGGNWSKNKNIVTDLFGAESVFLAGFVGTSSRAVEGEALGTLWGNRFARDASGNYVLDSKGFPERDNTEGIVGDPNPDWRGGANTSISYKGFKLSALMNASIGGDVWYGTFGALTHFGRTPLTANQVTVSAADAATIVNYENSQSFPNGRPINAISGAVENADGSFTVRGNLHDFGGGMVLLDEKYYSDLGSGFNGPSEQFIVDGSWAKLRELSLAYTLQGDFLKKTKLKSINLKITGRNLWLWTKDNLDFDPESNLTGASNGRGLQYFNHPTTKSYVASIQINF